MVDETETPEEQHRRTIAMSARATIDLFKNGAVAKTRERLAEVEAEGDEKSIAFWRDLLDEVTRLHKLRHKY